MTLLFDNKEKIKNLKLIVTTQEEVTATIKHVAKSKHTMAVKYSYEYEGKEEENRVVLSKQFGTKDYCRIGNKIRICIVKKENGLIKSTLGLFV